MTNTAPTELSQKAAEATENARLAISEATTTVGSSIKLESSKLSEIVAKALEPLGNMMRMMA